MRGITIQYGSRKKKASELREKFIIKEIRRIDNLASDDPTVIEGGQRLREEFQLMRAKRLEGVLVRSKGKWIEEGERPTKYYCGLEKRQYSKKYISSLEINGIQQNDQVAIMDYLKHFFEDVYQVRERPRKLEDIKHMLGQNFPKLSSKDNTEMEGLLSVQEASRAVAKLHNDKSPGPDGFTTIFFKAFWKYLGVFLVRSLNWGFKHGQLSVTQKQGAITLVPKTGKPKNAVENWRPISLLNTTQKILSATLANRLRKVMPKLIAGDQKGFMKNRYIGECIRTVYDIMWDAKYSDIERRGVMIFADYKRAFDSISHDFIFEVLDLFNFGPDLIRWVRTMLCGANSCVTQNKTATDFFPISRGCRQGDCCSPLLFILCVEVLGIMVRNNRAISGYRLGGVEINIEQYADDCTFILDGSEGSFAACMETTSVFNMVSGLELNEQKTQLLWLGRSRAPDFVAESEFNAVSDKFKYLGIVFTRNLLDMNVINFEAKAIDVRNLLRGWMRRKLTVYGKRTVLKTLALSKLTNIFTVLPSPPMESIKNLQKDFFKFIWNNGQDRIKRSHMLEQFGIPCLKTFSDALKVSWIRRLICSDSEGKLFALSSLRKSDLLFMCGGLSSQKKFI